jgi:alkylation response protein AidB-like acyl-CoA dehydrogenase
MRLIPDSDERDLSAMCRAVLAAESGAVMATLADAGILGLATAEEFGGSGAGMNELGVFSVEAGRALCPMVVHSTLHATRAIDWLGGVDARRAWLPALSSGAARGTTALWNPRDAANIAPVLRAQRVDDAGGRWRLSGAVDFVADADVADLLVVSAETDGRTTGFVVDPAAAGISVEPVAMMGAHRAFTVSFDDVAIDDPTRVLGGAQGLADNDLRRVANAAVALLCLDLVGVAEAVLQRTVDHTKLREQFGRPIASFQAAQHLVADMHIALAAARLAARSAVFWIGRGRTATRETAIARLRAAEVKRITLDAHQLHGGMGYVVDTGLYRYSERARVLSTLGGGADVAAKWLEGEMNWEGQP